MSDRHRLRTLYQGEATREEKIAFAAGLRALADFVEGTDAPLMRDNLAVNLWGATTNTIKEEDRALFNSRPRAMLRSIGGFVKKKESGDTMMFVRRFDKGGEHEWRGRVDITWSVSRDAVCVATPTGETREVRDWGVYTDEKAADALKAALRALEATKVVPVIEYDCKPVLGDTDGDVVNTGGV